MESQKPAFQVPFGPGWKSEPPQGGVLSFRRGLAPAASEHSPDAASEAVRRLEPGKVQADPEPHGLAAFRTSAPGHPRARGGGAPGSREMPTTASFPAILGSSPPALTPSSRTWPEALRKAPSHPHKSAPPRPPEAGWGRRDLQAAPVPARRASTERWMRASGSSEAEAGRTRLLTPARASAAWPAARDTAARRS